MLLQLQRRNWLWQEVSLHSSVRASNLPPLSREVPPTWSAVGSRGAGVHFLWCLCLWIVAQSDTDWETAADVQDFQQEILIIESDTGLKRWKSKQTIWVS